MSIFLIMDSCPQTLLNYVKLFIFFHFFYLSFLSVSDRKRGMLCMALALDMTMLPNLVKTRGGRFDPLWRL